MLEIDGTVVITFAVLWILVLVLNKIFFKPLQKIRTDRDSLLQGDRDGARAAADACASSLQSVDQALRDARTAAERLRSELEAEAIREKGRLLSEAGAAAKGEIEAARGEIGRQISGLKAELKAQAEGLAEQIERRLLS